MVMPASVIIVGGAVEPELSKPFNENDVLHNDAHASLEHTLAVVEVPEADVRRDPAEICVNVVYKTLIHRRKETRVREKHTVGRGAHDLTKHQQEDGRWRRSGPGG